MAEAEYTTTATLPIETIWDFVSEMDNWASFVAGYQQHEKQSASESIWTLKGDVGVLTRTLTFRVQIGEWSPPDRILFSLEGLNEDMKGEGSFTLEAWEGPLEDPTGPKKKPLARVFEAISRWIYRLFRGPAPSRAPAIPGSTQGVSRMTFKLRLDPGGPMAPMIDAMVQPMLLPTAEDLANRIMAHLESRHSVGHRAASK